MIAQYCGLKSPNLLSVLGGGHHSDSKGVDLAQKRLDVVLSLAGQRNQEIQLLLNRSRELGNDLVELTSSKGLLRSSDLSCSATIDAAA